MAWIFRLLRRSGVPVLLLFSWGVAAAAQPDPSGGNRPLIIPRAPSGIELDGRIDEPAWTHARQLPLAQQRPDFDAPPTEQTEILITYDESYVYAACRCFDSGTPSVSSFKRDYIDGDSDLFALILDTFHDDESALAFLTAPSGLRGDLAVSDDGTGPAPLDVNWNTFWSVETRQTSAGWFAEMRIPISSLRFQSESGDVVMGLSAGRLIARKSEDIVFPAIPPDWGALSRWRVSQFREVIFEELAPRPPLRITPYVLGGIDQRPILNNTESSYVTDRDLTGDVGLDVKYGLSSNFTLDLTVNTDFAQVEVDDQQVNLTRFPLFFPEKRRFFKERASNFTFNFGSPNRLFYSRRIGLAQGSQVRILGGARVVGRWGGWDVGMLSMQTAREPDLGPEGGTLPSENFSVLRLRREVLNVHSNVGGILTSRIGMDGQYNVAYGLDGRLRVVGDEYVTLKWAQTFEEAQRIEFAALDRARVQVLWERRSYSGFNYEFRYARAGLDYEPGLGFELRENYYRFGDRISYGWVPSDNSPIQRHRLSVEGAAFFRNKDGSLETLQIGPVWEAATDAGHSITLGAVHRVEDLVTPFALSEEVTVPAKRYTFWRGEASYGMPTGWPLRTNLGVTASTFFDGRRVSFEMSPTWNVSRYLRMTGTYQVNRVRFPSRSQSLTTHVQRLRFDVTPNVEYSIAGFVQYNSARDVVVGNVRFRYNPRQGNDLYLVYSEQLNTNRNLGVPQLPVSSQRALVVKYTHTFSR
jgi:hypothetical protein